MMQAIESAVAATVAIDCRLFGSVDCCDRERWLGSVLWIVGCVRGHGLWVNIQLDGCIEVSKRVA